MSDIKEIVKILEGYKGCNCDLDNWQPEHDTGHSHVCRIHRFAKEHFRNKTMPVARIASPLERFP